MKIKLLLTLFLCLPLLIQAQGEYDFEDDTFHNWTNTDGTTTTLTYETHTTTYPTGYGARYLLKTCDGSNTAEGEMAIKINLSNAGNGGFFYGEGWGTTFTFFVKNDNNFPLYLRMAFKGINNAIVVTETAVEVPALSGWTEMSTATYNNGIYGIGYDNMHTIDMGDYVSSGYPDNSFIQETLSNVAEFRILHNALPSFDGETVTGSLQIDNLFVLVPLSVSEKFLKAIQIYPNPVIDQLHINFPHKTKGTVTLTSIDGKQLLSQELTSEQMQLDVSKIKSKGIYFLKIETTSGTFSKKIVKS